MLLQMGLQMEFSKSMKNKGFCFKIKIFGCKKILKVVKNMFQNIISVLENIIVHVGWQQMALTLPISCVAR